MAVLIVRPAVEVDLENSQDWWDEREIGLGERFLSDVRVAFGRISRHPEIGHRLRRPVCQKFLVRRFHHGIFYRVRSDLVEVVAVLDLRRDPREIARTLGRRV